jgi:TPR repeat protein
MTQNFKVPPLCKFPELPFFPRFDLVSPKEPPVSIGNDRLISMKRSNFELMRLALKFASSKWPKRNLGLCAQFIQPIRGKITDSLVFQGRATYGKGSQATKCGFVVLLLGDYEFAQKLFLRASGAGDMTATLMVGLMLFHGIGVQRDVNRGCHFLAKCMTDPIALLHLGVEFKDNLWFDRGAVILNVPATALTAAFEALGDCYFDGVKLPKDLRIARLWYGLAVKQAEIENVDNRSIIRKLSLLV